MNVPKYVVTYKNFWKSSYVDTFLKVLMLPHGLNLCCHMVTYKNFRVGGELERKFLCQAMSFTEPTEPIFGRTDLRKGVSKAKFDAEADFEVRLPPDFPKPHENLKKTSRNFR